ncbi:VAN3-binding protein [Humulus lupulus]|uniref:VAN3-binding protein n=1 Tax=Humulus lupulus TaxID=3486 RepID=UPI002B416585|nr:VAN3-binding protein [Humulus lupulus]
MDSSLFNPTPSPSEAHPETLDFLSNAWCNFAVQALQPDSHHHDHHQQLLPLDYHQSMALIDQNPMIIKKIDTNTKSSPYMSTKMEDADAKSLPPWKSNDVKSWIWMQQAMHPELNYNGYFKKRWAVPFKNVISIKKWLKDIKQRRKEEERLQKAEVHAAISVAGVAAALAVVAAENSKKDSSNAKEAAVASAAALVASQCAKVAEAMGAKREQLSCVIGSAITGTNATDIFTLATAAKTSLKGAATLKVRTGCKNKLNGVAPILPIEESHELGFDLETYRSVLAKGAELGVETPDGDFLRRSVSVILSSEGKVVLQIKKLSLLKKKKESIVLDLHAELYKDSDAEATTETCYLLVLTTSKGIFKLDMGDDYQRYKTWAKTISQMLLLSSSITKYEHHF